MRVSATTDFSGLHSFARQLDENLDRAVRFTAFAVERDAKRGAPVDTGALRASIFTVTAKGNQNRGQSEAQAAKRRANIRFGSFKRDPISKEAYVVAGADYARVVNATHPTNKFFMERARRKNEPTLRREVRKAINDIRL